MSLNAQFPKQVPFLPGHVFSDPYKENHHKTQQFSNINGTVQEKTNFIHEEFDPNLLDSMKMGTPPNLTYGSRQPPENDYIPRIQPPWLKYDRAVLRFYSYFQESVVENPNENYRIRQVIIYYYLSDGTIHVTEPRVQNSGIPQGLFIKRQKIPKKLGKQDFYTWEDLQLCSNINFYDRVYRICDCDTYTREFYEYMGKPLQLPEQLPRDNFQAQKETKDLKINPPDTKEYKEYFEVKLGGGHPNGGLNKYLSNDRKVLSFDIIWDDASIEGQLNYYTLNYYLADETCEVKEVRKPNSGKDPYPLMLRRQKIPKQPILTHYPGMTLKKEEFYGPLDLICGNQVKIYGRDCFIYGCDDFTKEYYLKVLGIQQKPATLKQERGKKFYQPVPPYNGYGYEEDSLGSVYSLQPKPPKKDVRKNFTQDQFILRFESRLISEVREENQRRFIISFYCGDDTIQVYLTSERNSGIWGGKFQERSRQKNPLTNDYYTEKDFQLGAIVQFNVYKFQLMRADEFTINYMKQKPDVFKEADIKQIIAKLRMFADNYPNFDSFLLDIMKKLDKQLKGQIEFEELAAGLQELGFNLTLQEQYYLMREFDISGEWKLNMQALWEGIGGKRS
ncbi:unnamed protein product [Paramecium primaurelia]|uniref:EF-hand domain-containing protein n=1 Tax=Paramecium primaurelia TaxID=5886 RepID=A0A8S1MPJ1_PARPR|nr:unnamed protein product [Paramecium primaurelia]